MVSSNLNTNPPPSMLVRKYKKGNFMIMGGLLAGITSIYAYTIWSTSRGSFSTDELESTVEKK